MKSMFIHSVSLRIFLRVYSVPGNSLDAAINKSLPSQMRKLQIVVKVMRKIREYNILQGEEWLL